MYFTQILKENSKTSWIKNNFFLGETNHSNSDSFIDIYSINGWDYPLKNQIRVDEKKLEKLNRKFGPTCNNFVGESNKIKNAERGNIGHISNKQLNDKLDKLEIVNCKKLRKVLVKAKLDQ